MQEWKKNSRGSKSRSISCRKEEYITKRNSQPAEVSISSVAMFVVRAARAAAFFSALKDSILDFISVSMNIGLILKKGKDGERVPLITYQV